MNGVYTSGCILQPITPPLKPAIKPGNSFTHVDHSVHSDDVLVQVIYSSVLLYTKCKKCCVCKIFSCLDWEFLNRENAS